MDPSTHPSRPRVALALQGGGAHGAYSWGVIERLLEEEIDLVAVSGASAGAINGAALVAGFAQDGTKGATAGLERLWRAVSKGSPLSLFDVGGFGNPFFELWFGRSMELAKLTSRYTAPLFPTVRDMRALRRVVEATVDLDLLARQTALPLHVSATRVASGSARLFTGAAVTLDALMASACLPELFAPVTIDGEAYWDGGFTANPALEPLLLGDAQPSDLIIVQVTPFEAVDDLTSLSDVTRRISDISFNACLVRDLRTLTELQDVARRESSSDPRMQAIARTNLHLIEPPAALSERGAASKIDTRWTVLQELRALGRASAEAWLGAHRDVVGRASSLDAMPDAIAYAVHGA